MTKTLARASVLSTLVAFVPLGAVLAADDVDSVTISPVSLSGCGAQSVTISGTATYSEPTQHLVVTVDGVEMLHSHAEPSSWTLGSVALSEGSHTVTATMYDHSAHEDVVATHSQTVNTTCSTSSSSTSASSAGSTGGSGDCCPGQDEPSGTVKAAKKVVKGRVKGAVTTKGLPARLAGVNVLFRKVYGRNPTFQEWEYWAQRYWSDKPQYDALYGAMQWHKNLGHTTGGPNPIKYWPGK